MLLRDGHTDPEPWLREPAALGRVKPRRIIRVQLGSSAQAPPGSERLSLGRHRVHPQEGRPPYASENPQQESREPAKVEEPSGMLGITRVQSSSSTTLPPGPELALPEGRRLLPPDLSMGMLGITRMQSTSSATLPPAPDPGGEVATAARFVHGTAAHASRKRTAIAVKLPSRPSSFGAGKMSHRHQERSHRRRRVYL